MTPSNQIKTLEFLQKYWEKMSADLQILPEKRTEGFKRFLNLYTAPNRKYHGIYHIANMLNEIDKFQAENLPLIKESALLTLAVFMHDAVNGTKEDIADSFLEAKAVLDSSQSAEVRAKTPLLEEMIQATQHAYSQQHRSLECALIADVDLAVLGAPSAEYQRYTKQIRQEYAQYNDMIFVQGRQIVLSQFLRKKTIYTLPYFQEKFEKQARQNLLKEMKLLQRPLVIKKSNPQKQR